MAKKKEELLTATEVCVLVGISIYTLNTWCKFKQVHPEHELAKLIPIPTQSNPRGPRLWKRSDVEKLMEFKSKRPRGRNGVMGELQPKGRRAKNGKKSTRGSENSSTNRRRKKETARTN